MLRKVIKIEVEKCNGCGLCVNACHESAIGLVNGKAKLLRDDYCDGLGNCLPVCPTGAISFEEREAAAFDEAAVRAAQNAKIQAPIHTGCPGTRLNVFHRESSVQGNTKSGHIESQLRQWPCQLALVPKNAPYFENAHLLVAADCSAYAYANFHQEFIKDKITLIGCPKLDEMDYTQKLTAILKNNKIRSVTVVRMEVPCCGGIVEWVLRAIKDSEKTIPYNVVIISTDGKIIKD